MTRLSVAALLLSLSVACGDKSPGAYSSAVGEAVAQNSAVSLEQADVLWADRIDEAKLIKALDAYEQVVKANPDDRRAYQQLVRGWYFYGDALTTDKEKKIERWGTAIGWGKRCLALNQSFVSQVDAGQKERDAVEAATVSDVPCLYWTSAALGKWAKIQSLSTTLKHLPTVKAFIAKAETLEPQYFHFGPARYWGAYYAALPSFAGQDLEKSASFFASSIAGAPGYLGTRVLRAEYTAVLTQDIALFRDDLAFVLKADPNAVKGIEAENTLEQRKAQALLDKTSELFSADLLQNNQ